MAMIEYIRIAILDKLNTVIGYMDNSLPDALKYYDDNLHIYLQGTASTFEFTVSTNENGWFSKLKIGNHLSFRYLSRDYYFQIVSTEQTEDALKVTAYSACLELITETCPAYAAEGKTFVEYLEAFDPAGVLTVGKNEIKDYSRSCSWDGEATQLSRLYSLASNFDAEIEFVPVLNDDYTLDKMVINIYHDHDDDNQGIGTNRINGRRLRYGKSLKGITKTSDITGLYTNILATGKDGITLAGYTPNDDGTAYVKKDDNGNVLYKKDVDSAYLLAPYAAKQFPSHVTGDGDDYILYRWSTDYTTQKRLFSKALSKLKSLSSPQVIYEIDASYGDYYADGGSTDSTRYFYGNIGDTITVIDEEFEPPLYLEARISELEISFTDTTKNKATFTNIDELEAGVISAAVQEQIAQAKSLATTAKASADTATAKASEAQTAAETAQSTAESASTTASEAKTTATAAQTAAESAQTTAESAQSTAETAQTTANTAKSTAETAQSTANTAQTTANTAKSTADTAKSTADATATNLAANYSTTADTNDAIATAKTEAVSTAAEDATTKANKAKTDAISTASADATSKADAAESNAKTYAEEKVSAVSNYFWHDADGAHVSNESTIGTDTRNVLLTSDGMSICKGEKALATFADSGIYIESSDDISGYGGMLASYTNDTAKQPTLMIRAGVEKTNSFRGYGKVSIFNGINNYQGDDPTVRSDRICRIECDNTTPAEGTNSLEAPHTTIHTHDLTIDNNGIHGEGDTDDIVKDKVSVTIKGELNAGNNNFGIYSGNGVDNRWMYLGDRNGIVTDSSVSVKADTVSLSGNSVKSNGSPILTQADVSSTYSATGTAPVNGTAVASAIPTADIDANTAARHTHANQSVLDGILTANVGNWNTAYTNARYLTNSSVLKGITADMVSSWDDAFQERTDTPTDADDAPMGMCTVSGKTCSNLPDTTNQYWLFTFFNANGNGIQLAKRTTQAFVLYMRTKNNSGTSAWKSITFS